MASIRRSARLEVAEELLFLEAAWSRSFVGDGRRGPTGSRPLTMRAAFSANAAPAVADGGEAVGEGRSAAASARAWPASCRKAA